jgi:nucleoid-associated protein YgaU
MPIKVDAGEISSYSTGEVTLTGKTYKVAEGDNLWTIAERAYGDGQGWVQLAKANNIPNPDLIMPGTTLTIPR